MLSWFSLKSYYSVYSTRKDYELLKDSNQLLANPVCLSPFDPKETGRVLFSLSELPLSVKYIAPNSSIVQRVSEFLVTLGVEGGKQYEIAVEEDKTKKENKTWRKEFNKNLSSKKEKKLVHVAATRIQALYKGILTRRKYKRLLKRSRITREILSTEETYLKELTTMIDIFLVPLRESGFVAVKDLKTVFSEVESLQLFHKQFCQKLSQRIKRNPLIPIGEVFLELPLYFSAYTNYINNYDRAIKAYEEISNRPQVTALLREIQAKEQCQGKNLPTFMIIPVQRVPRYVMLLQDLLKNTLESDSDYQNLSSALEQIKQMATAINSRKREAENLNEVVRIHYSLVPKSQKAADLLQPHRRFVYESETFLVEDGEWSKFSEEKSKTAHLFLCNDVLLVTTPTKKSRTQGKTKIILKKLLHMFNVSDMTFTPIQDSVVPGWSGFQISDKDQQFSFITQPKTSALWSEKIASCLQPVSPKGTR